MKVLLIYPPITLHKNDVSTPSKTVLIGLRYLSSVLKNAGHEVELLDCLTKSNVGHDMNHSFKRYGLSDKEVYERVAYHNPDMVGISSMYTSYHHDAHNVAKLVKKFKKGLPVVMGGSHTSTFPEEVMKDRNVDYIVIGEGERAILEVLKQPKKRIHKEPFISDLDSIPFPDWDISQGDLDVIKEENRVNKYLMRPPVGYILTSRGCPNECYFCSVKLAWGRKWRYRSPQNVVDEIELLVSKGYREIHFVDDNSSVNYPRMRGICKEIIRRKLDIRLATPTGISIKSLNGYLLKYMKEAGFYRLCFGIETGSVKGQEIIKKHLDLEKAKLIIDLANSMGFWTAATFIIGFPHEKYIDIFETLKFAKESGLDFSVFYLLTPQPKTEVYRLLKSQGLVDLDPYISPASNEWWKLSITYSNGLKTKYFNNDELQQLLSDIYHKLLWHKALTLLTYKNLVNKIKSWEDLKYLMRLIGVPIKMLFKKRLANVSIRDKREELR